MIGAETHRTDAAQTTGSIPRSAVRPRVIATVALALFAGLAGVAPGRTHAHALSVDQVIAQLRAPDMVEAFDVVSVDRSADLDRLLLVRVGPGWQRADPALRREASQKWLHMWRAATRNGIVAVVDAASEVSLVGFDADGRATLKSPQP